MKLNKKLHLPPGTPVYTGTSQVKETTISILKYNLNNCESINIKNIKEIEKELDSDKVIWIEIKGAIKEDIIKELGEEFKIHTLVLEDILSVSQNPKLEDYNEYFYLVMKSINFKEEISELYSEQISIILKNNIIITFQESDEEIFSHIKNRIINGILRIRSMNSNYLLFCILDLLVDNYLITLSSIVEKFEVLELKIIENFDEAILNEIYFLKKDISNLKKNFWHLKAMFFSLKNTENFSITNGIEAYFRDLSDKSLRILDSIENLRDFSSSLIELNNSLLGNKLNQIMKTLTIISTIFIPLSFLAGLYGMNFKLMPELDFKYGYPILIFVMISLSTFMLFYFKKKKWF